MAEQPQQPLSSTPLPSQQQKQREEMMGCVAALEAALLACLPARELQAVDRSVHSSLQSMQGILWKLQKMLQLSFIGLQREDQPSREEMLREEISIAEEELKIKSELIKKHTNLIRGWRKKN